MKRTLLILTLGLLCSPLRSADFAPVFADNAVLQRELPVRIWGSGRDGEVVTVQLQGKSATCKVSQGRWQVELPALAAAESETLSLKGDNEVQLRNIAVGEVWIGSGQSNMEWRLAGCAPFYDALLASANDPGIRELKIPLRTHPTDPLVGMQWKLFKTGTAAQFGAVAYFFAAELHRKLGVPVGIVNCSFGGTPIQAWMERDSILAAGAKDLLVESARKAATFATEQDYENALQAFLSTKKEREARKKAGATAAELGPDPKEPYGYRSKEFPGALHASMLGVIYPYTARGVLWYQGENNGGAKNYAALLSQFIGSMRQQWQRPDWPFLLAQLSTPSPYHPDEGDSFVVVREAQLSVAKTTPYCGFVVTLDYGEKGNVHPKQKQPVGERLARLALGRVYGKQGFAAQSPSAAQAKKEGGSVLVTFVDLPGRIELRGDSIPCLEVQSGTGQFQPAKGDILPDGKALRVTLPDGVSDAKAVRYAWRNFCTLSLFSDEGLPVSPWSLPVTASP